MVGIPAISIHITICDMTIVEITLYPFLGFRPGGQSAKEIKWWKLLGL